MRARCFFFISTFFLRPPSIRRAIAAPHHINENGPRGLRGPFSLFGSSPADQPPPLGGAEVLGRPLLPSPADRCADSYAAAALSRSASAWPSAAKALFGRASLSLPSAAARSFTAW